VSEIISQALAENEPPEEQVSPESNTSTKDSSEVEKRLQQLSDLKTKDLISEKDYNKKKEEILNVTYNDC